MASVVKITFLADARKLSSALKALDTDLNTTASKLDRIANTLSTKVSVPLAAVGVGALKLAANWEIGFSRLVGLADVPAAEIARLKKEVAELAGETGQAPQTLVEALYSIASAGIPAADAMEVLTVAAKGSAAGLGSAAVVADILTSVINAYGRENITAARAGDILTAAVTVGKGEAESFAPVMGRLVPLSAKLGISFDSVAGTLAVMTRTGMSAAEAATGLNSMLATMLGTSNAGVKVLNEHGLSLQKLRDVAAGPGGLVAVMRLLDETFGDNVEALELIIPNIRAMRAQMNITAQDAGSVSTALGYVTNSQGALQRATDEYLKTSAAKLVQSWQKMKVAMIEIGNAIMPIAVQVANLGSAIFDVFGKLPDFLQSSIVGFALILAAVGPVIKIVTMLGSSFKILASVASKAFDKIAVGAYNAAGATLAQAAATGAATIAIGLLIYAWQRSEAAKAKHKADLKDLEQSYFEVDGALNILTDDTKKYIIEQSRFHDRNQIDDLNRIGVSAKELTVLMTQGTRGLETFTAAVVKGGEVQEVFADKQNNVRDAQGKYIGQTKDAITVNGRLYAGNKDLIASFVKEQALLEEVSRSKIDAAMASGDLTDAQEAEIAAYVKGGVEGERYTLTAVKYASVIHDATKATDGAIDGVTELQRTQMAAASTATAYAASQKAAATAIDELFSKMYGSAGVTLELDDAFGTFNDTMDDTKTGVGAGAKVMDVYAEKAKDVAAATKDVTRAEERHITAIEDVAKAQKNVLDIEKDLADLLKGPSDRSEAELKNAAAGAELDLADATDKVADAQLKLAEATADDDPQAVIDAKRDLTRAQLDLERSVWRNTDSLKAYEDIKNWSADTDTDVIKTRDKLKEAQDKVAEAVKDTTSRYEDLITAQTEVSDLTAMSVEHWDTSAGAATNHGKAVDQTAGAYQRLSERIKEAIKNIVGLEVSGADSAAKIDKITAMIRSNPFLNDDQKEQLLQFASQARSKVYTDTSNANDLATIFGGQIPFFADGGVVPGPRGAPILITAHGGEEIYDTHKTRPSYVGSQSGLTIGTINMNSNASAADLARELRWLQMNGLK